ncbi:MAG: hypothetical protein B6230_03375 [Desulfobacteraceae bacterium 4572_89]|nr:MAG: hypothetical protein B6230_03375 [Desulfobacteraceae bacterium 4572_89]
MVEKKHYYSVGRTKTDPVRTARIKIKRSVFTCSLAFAASIEEAKVFITKISKENKIATHNCWAYIVGEQGEISHSSDSGEPAGTAGKPMLNALLSHDMTCIAAVVTRQFGGVKLGIRGLIQAYSESVTTAIELKPLVKLIKIQPIQVEISYGMNETFLNQLSRFRAIVQHSDYGENIVHGIQVEKEDMQEVEAFLSEYQCQGRLKYHLSLKGEKY